MAPAIQRRWKTQTSTADGLRNRIAPRNLKCRCRLRPTRFLRPSAPARHHLHIPNGKISSPSTNLRRIAQNNIALLPATIISQTGGIRHQKTIPDSAVGSTVATFIYLSLYIQLQWISCSLKMRIDIHMHCSVRTVRVYFGCSVFVHTHGEGTEV